MFKLDGREVRGYAGETIWQVANLLTNAALDPESNISAYKFAAVRVERIAAAPTAEGLNATAC